MKEGPDISHVASLIGEPARAQMLLALMDRRALTATELATEAGVTKQTASGHLAKLQEGGMVSASKQGRHRYYRLDDDDVARALEALMGVAERKSGRRVRPGPKDPAMRKARVCYDHLAGETGVLALDQMLENGWIARRQDDLDLTAAGREAFNATGISLDRPASSRRPECRACLDWSVRRYHLGGHAGKVLLDWLLAERMVSRDPQSRVLRFSKDGEKAFNLWLAAPTQ